MKGIIALVLCTALLMPIAASAGEDHNGHGKKAHKLGKELNMSKDQVEQMKAINKDAQAKRKAIKDLPEEDRKAAAQKLREERRAQTDALLTPEQRQKLAEMKAARKAKKR